MCAPATRRRARADQRGGAGPEGGRIRPSGDGACGAVPAEERAGAMGQAHAGRRRRGGDVDARVTGELLGEARRRGAKVVLAGDDRQLGFDRARRALRGTDDGMARRRSPRSRGSASTGSGGRRAIWPRGGSRRRCGPSTEHGALTGRRPRRRRGRAGGALDGGHRRPTRRRRASSSPTPTRMSTR